MVDWLMDIATSWNLTWAKAGWAAAFFAVSFIGSLLFVSFLLVKLPADYFANSLGRDNEDRHPVWRCASIIGRNVLGYFLVVIGVVLSLPGFPGQGIITILIGLALIDFPGKRRLLRWMLRHPKALDSINRLRQRYGKMPLRVC